MLSFVWESSNEEEFEAGVMKLKGFARAVDLNKLTRQAGLFVAFVLSVRDGFNRIWLETDNF